MTNTDIINVSIALNTAQAQKKLDEVNNRLTHTRQLKDQAFERGDAAAYKLYTQEVARLEREQKRLQSRTDTVTRTLRNLDQATPRALRDTITQINRQLNSGSIQRGSTEWNTLTHALQEARAELQRIREEQQAVAQSPAPTTLAQRWHTLVDTFTNIKGKIVEVFNTIGQYVEQHAQIDEHLSNVRKYTGLTREAVEDLNESFKQMDTRTAREQLNDLAADAGRLGIQSRQDILDFVSAADQINVALGEDLGEGAVKSIGKLAQMFTEADRLGLKQGMLSIGSTINELAQSSSASEAYILEFTNRLAGVATQSGLTASQVMALASVMDQNAVNVEKGATALQNVLVALYQQPAKMAKAAGLEVKKFTRLLSTDANTALQTFLSALNQKGGMDRLAPILKEMNLSGAGVTQTLTTLTAHLNDLRQAQDQANRAFQEGTSCTNEANLANNTLSARIDRARKHLADLRDELGQRLTPIYLHFLTTTGTLADFLSHLIKAISQATTYFAAHAREVATAVVAITTFTIALKAQAIQAAVVATWHKAASAAVTIYTAVTKGATAATIAFNAAAKSNGITALVSLLLSAVAAFLTYTLSTLRAANATRQLTLAERTRLSIQRDTATINQRAQQSMAQEVSRITTLTAIIHSNARSLDDRRRAISELQKIIPTYTATITQEGRVTKEATTAVNDYITALRKKYIIQAAQTQLQSLAEEDLYHNEQLTKYQRFYDARLKKLRTFEKQNAEAIQRIHRLEAQAAKGDTNAAQLLASSATARHYQQLKDNVTEANHLLAGTTDYLTTINHRQQSIITTATRLGATIDQLIEGENTLKELSTPDTTSLAASTPSGGTPTPDRNTTALQRIKDQNQQARLALQVSADQNVITHQEADNRILEADIQMYQQIRDLYKEGSTEYLSAEHSRLQAAQKLREQQAAQTITALKAQEQVEQNQLTAQYIKRDITQKQYQQSQLQIKLKYLQLYIAKATAADDQDARARYQKEYDELYQSGAIERVRDFWQRVDQARAEWLAKTPQEQRQEDIDFAAILKKQGILSPEEYKRAIEYINEKYKGKEGGDNKKDDTSSALPSSTDPLSQSFISVAQAYQHLQDDIKENGTASWQSYAAIGVASISTVNAALSQATQLMQASMQAQVATVTARYDREIKLAGTNTRRAKQLEEQKQKEIARIKSAYARRQTKMQIAQAILTTAQNALGAYNSMISIPFAGPALAAAAAAAATAAGLIQVAIIRKQAAAQEEGYYQGGFTPGRNYRRPAGIVHQGEFVANHQAVLNPALQPVLQLIDHAQRTGRVSSLTPLDITQTITSPLLTTQPRLAATALTHAATTQPLLTQTLTPTDTTTTDPLLTPTDPTDPTLNLPHLLRDLNDNLSRGIQAHVVLSELDRQYRRYNRLTSI